LPSFEDKLGAKNLDFDLYICIIAFFGKKKQKKKWERKGRLKGCKWEGKGRKRVEIN
jgi:hypothetical protein